MANYSCHYLLYVPSLYVYFVSLSVDLLFEKESVVSQMIHFSYLVFQNLLIVKDVELPNYYGGIGYLGFEKLTFVPIQVCKHILL